MAPGHAESGLHANSRFRDFSAEKEGFAHRRLRFSCLGPRILPGKGSGLTKIKGCLPSMYCFKLSWRIPAKATVSLLIIC